MNTKTLAALAAAAISTSALADNNPAYWIGSDGDYARGGDGKCVRTISWTKAKAIAGCEGGDMGKSVAAPAKTKPAAAPAPVAKAPAPAPTPAKATAKAEPQYRNLSLSSGASFEFGGSKLSGSGKAAVASILRQFEGEKIKAVVVEGHTDSQGPEAFNQQLSEQRARAVRDELIANGVDAKLITTKGYGESRPLADNGTREGRAQNRRVNIKIDASSRKL